MTWRIVCSAAVFFVAHYVILFGFEDTLPDVPVLSASEVAMVISTVPTAIAFLALVVVPALLASRR